MTTVLEAITEYPDGIFAIDSGYVRPNLDAIYVLRCGSRTVIIDTGTAACVPIILACLRCKAIDLASVEYVILTHVHLDHAGGAGRLLAELPNARLLVHPRGARHMIDPAKLIAGTIEVYGAEQTRRHHGNLMAVPASRVVVVEDGDAIELGDRRLVFYDTPGHARHHHCIHDVTTGTLFTGDMFGLSYREWDRAGRAFVFPATTPVNFDPPAFHRSIARLMALQPTAAYVTHYGRIEDLPRLAVDLLRLVDAHAALVLALDAHATPEHALEHLRQGVAQLVMREAEQQPWAVSAADALELMQMDILLNAQGLMSWRQQRLAT